MKKIFLIFISALLLGTYIYADDTCSKWAEDSISSAVEAGIVPESLQSDYTKNITRQEFCRLAVQTYIVKTDNKTNISFETPFEDIDDESITTAYYLKIVSGINDNEFAPYNNITRQEAAVMLNNLADVLNVYKDSPRQEKYTDEGYFADWAKDAVYSVTGIESGDTYVMTGTEPNKFSPWMNYTREQAIATMWRLYNCNTRSFEFVLNNSEDDGYIYFDYDDNDSQYIARLNKNGSEPEILAEEPYIEIKKITDEHIYYIWSDTNTMYLSRMNKDGADSKILLEGIGAYSVAMSDNNIFYCSLDKVTIADMEGNTLSEFNIPDEFSIVSVNRADGSKVYINLMPKENETPSEPVSYSYKYDFETGELTDIDDESPSYSCNDAGVTDGRYIYYKVTKIVGWSHPMASYYISKCNMDRSEEVSIGALNLNSAEKLFPYGNCMYTTAFYGSANIVRVFANGGTQKITDFDRYYDNDVLSDISILDIYDGVIYYKMGLYDAMNNDKTVRICSIKTDGTDNKTICDL